MAKDVIILNRMYVGDYLGENIGHEVINLMKPDNGNDYYIYINARGDVKGDFIKDKSSAKSILLTRWCRKKIKSETVSFIEVLAKAEELHLCDTDFVFNKNDIIPFIKSKEQPKGYDYKTVKYFIKNYYKKLADGIKTSYKLDPLLKGVNLQITNSLKEQAKKSLHKKAILNVIQKYKNELYKNVTKPMKVDLHKLQKLYLEKQNVTYGSHTLEEIFEINVRNEQALYVTFRAESISKIKKNVKLYFVENEDDGILLKESIKTSDQNQIYIENVKANFSKSSLKQYVDDSEIVAVLNSIITDNKYWDSQELPTYKEMTDKKNNKEDFYINITPNKSNFIEIIKKEYDELTYTNLFYYMFKSSPDLFLKFANSSEENGGLGLNIPNNYKNITISREEGNIDLLVDIRDENNKIYLIVIENKIKSGINGIRINDETGKEDGNQLSKYIHYAHGYRVTKGTDKTKYEYKKFDDDELELKPYDSEDCERYFFIFAPKYKNFTEADINKNLENFIKKADINMSDKNNQYKIRTYDKLLNFFKNQIDLFNKEYKKPLYYEEFLYAIERHSGEVDNIQERQMFERFAERINELAPENNQGDN